MTSRWGAVNINRLSRESGVGLGTVARLKTDDNSIGLDKLDRFAQLFGVDPWKLLHPSFEAVMDRHQALSPMALDVARSLDEITDPAAQSRAHALVVQVLQLANVPALGASESGVTPMKEPRSAQ